MRTCPRAAVAGLAGLLTLGLAVTGCGSRHAGAAAGAPRPPGPAGPAVVASYRLAVREARRLLAAFQVPAGAVRASSVPRVLDGPAMGTPSAGRSLIDKARLWRVPLPFGQARGWLSAHAPKGLAQNGSMSAAGPSGTTMVGLSFAGPRATAWQSASLNVGVARAAGGSVIRADGVVVWLDPRPLTVPPGGVRMRLTVAGGCPATDRKVTGVRNSAAAGSATISSAVSSGGEASLWHRLVPAGAPTGGLVCRYNGMNGRAWHLRSSRRLTAGQARHLARVVAGTPLSHVDGGASSCPADDGSARFTALAYPGRPDVDLMVSPGGCGGISNGFIVAGWRA
jgi:hypothetical protein